MQVDFADIKMRVVSAFESWKEGVLAYYRSLTRWQEYAWLAVIAGIILIIVAVVLW